LCYKGTSDVGALLSMWHDTPGPGGSVGHHYPCLTTEHLKHQDGWRPMFECRYKNCFLGDIFMIFLKKELKGKNYTPGSTHPSRSATKHAHNQPKPSIVGYKSLSLSSTNIDDKTTHPNRLYQLMQSCSISQPPSHPENESRLHHPSLSCSSIGLGLAGRILSSWRYVDVYPTVDG
jgi:hypothetical protein